MYNILSYYNILEVKYICIFWKLKEKGYSVINLDINIIAEKPKINKYVSKMIKNISTLLQIKNTSVSIKATTNEKIGFIGNGEGIAAESIVHITDDKIS